MLFHLSEKNALAAYPDGGMGSVWWLVAMSWDNFKEWRGYDALPVPEILGIASMSSEPMMSMCICWCCRPMCSSWKTILSASANTRHCKATRKAYSRDF